MSVNIVFNVVHSG